VDEIAQAVSKVASNLESLAGADPSLAGIKAVSRSERPKPERARNY
jgi:hypothetical protein